MPLPPSLFVSSLFFRPYRNLIAALIILFGWQTQPLAAQSCTPAELTSAGFLRAPIAGASTRPVSVPVTLAVGEFAQAKVPDFRKKAVLFRDQPHRVLSQWPAAGSRLTIGSLSQRPEITLKIAAKAPRSSAVGSLQRSNDCITLRLLPRDTAAPSITTRINGLLTDQLPVGPQGMPYLTGNQFLVEASASDSLDPNPEVRISIDGQPYSGGELESYGVHNLVVGARDSSGNVEMQTFQFENRIAPYLTLRFEPREAFQDGLYLQGAFAIFGLPGTTVNQDNFAIAVYTATGERMALFYQSENGWYGDSQFLNLETVLGETWLRFRVSIANEQGQVQIPAWMQIMGSGTSGDVSEVVQISTAVAPSPNQQVRPIILVPGSIERNPPIPYLPTGPDSPPVTIVPTQGQCRWALFMNPVRTIVQVPGSRVPRPLSPSHAERSRRYDTDGWENWSEDFYLAVAPTFSDGMYEVSARATEASGAVEGNIRFLLPFCQSGSWLRDYCFEDNGFLTFFNGSVGRRTMLSQSRAMDATLALVGDCRCKICDIRHDGVIATSATCQAEGSASAAAYSGASLTPGCPRDDPGLADKKLAQLSRCVATAAADTNLEAQIGPVEITLPGIEVPTTLPAPTESNGESFSCNVRQEDPGFGARCVSENQFKVQAGVLAFARVDSIPGGASYVASAKAEESGRLGLSMLPIAGPCNPAGNGVQVRIDASTPGDALNLFRW